MERVLVVGTSGAGKTTLARDLAAALGARHVELDALFWEPGWQEAEVEDFRRRVAAALDVPRWVACGNYWSKAKDLTWARADTVVWLDLPARTCYRRIVVRTVRRSLGRVELWSGNRESIRNLWGPSSLLREVRPRKALFATRYVEAAADPAFAHLDVVRLRSHREVRRWRRRTGMPAR